MSELTMVERVARALAAARGLDPDGVSPEPGSPKVWECHLHHARAALAAMRDPPLRIRDAMNDVWVDGPAYVDMNLSMCDCGRLFTAGIDAALAEGQGAAD